MSPDGPLLMFATIHKLCQSPSGVTEDSASSGFAVLNDHEGVNSMRRPLRALGPLLLALFVAVPVQSLVPSPVNAQQQEEDVVYLKDGSVLRGTIIEDVPGESLRIRTRDGNVFRISYDRIDRRTREAAVVAAPTPAATPSQPRAQVTTGRKSPGLAFFLSFLVVGAGQGYNGQWGKAFLMAGGVVGSFAIANAGADKCTWEDDCGQVAGGVIGMLGFALWSWIDAPISASAINTRLDMGVALELGPRPRLGFPSDALASSISGGRSTPQVGISLVRVGF